MTILCCTAITSMIRLSELQTPSLDIWKRIALSKPQKDVVSPESQQDESRTGCSEELKEDADSTTAFSRQEAPKGRSFWRAFSLGTHKKFAGWHRNHNGTRKQNHQNLFSGTGTGTTAVLAKLNRHGWRENLSPDEPSEPKAATEPNRLVQ